MIQDILVPFIAVGLAELGDKTQLAVFCMSSQTKRYFNLLLGVMLGFAITDGLAIILGNIMSNLVPIGYVKVLSGIIFIVFGILTLLNSKEDEKKCNLKNPFMSGFFLILISEMGDKTQIASGLFAAQYNPFLVFIGVLFALLILSAFAVFAGKFLFKKMNKKTISYAAGALFIVLGIAAFF